MSCIAIEKLEQRVDTVNSLVSVGLDTNIDHVPEPFRNQQFPQYEFNKWIIDHTHEFVCAYKPNLAFYEARGESGWKELKMTMEYLKDQHPDIFTIADAKRADIGSTNEGYVRAIYDQLGFDSVTLHPYFGREAMMPFVDRQDKVSIVLCTTSNPGAYEIQDLPVVKNLGMQNYGEGVARLETKPLWQVIAEDVRDSWNKYENCMLVVGATKPEVITKVRSLTGEMYILVPGVGAQGGNLEMSVRNGINDAKKGVIINSSRSIIFSTDPAAETVKLRDTINKFRS